MKKGNLKKKSKPITGENRSPEVKLHIAPQHSSTAAIETKTEQKNRSLISKLFKSKTQVLLFNGSQNDDLKGLLECFYLAALFRQKSFAGKRVILVDSSNFEFVEQTGLFDTVIPISSGDNLKEKVSQLKPYLIFSPPGGAKGIVALNQMSARIKLVGGKRSLLSTLFRVRHLSSAKDQQWLKKRGMDLTPEYVTLDFDFKLHDLNNEVIKSNYVWLSLFDQHILNGDWPVGHAARLARLLEKDDLKVVIPLQPSASAEIISEADYLKQSAKNVIILPECSLQMRLAGMLHSQAVVAPAGPETILAALIRKPAFLIHDMISINSYVDNRGLKLVESDGALPTEQEPVTDNPLLFKIANSQEKHIKPSVVKCSNDCNDCAYSSCTEFISPERVYEKLKSLFSPF